MADTVETMDDGAMACTTLSAFPFLTPDEFDAACRALAERTRSCTAAQLDGGWSSARLVTQVYIPVDVLHELDFIYSILKKDVALTFAGPICLGPCAIA
jgi:hypothetical protein